MESSITAASYSVVDGLLFSARIGWRCRAVTCIDTKL